MMFYSVYQCAPINSKLQHPPHGQTPGHLNFWRLDRSNSLSSGQKSCSNAPPNSAEIPPLKDKFRLQSNIFHNFHKEICRDDTLKLLLKALLKKLFTNKGEILSCKSLENPKNTHGSITPEQEINLIQIPHPSKATFKFLPSRAQCTVKCPGYARGWGDVEVRIDQRISFTLNDRQNTLVNTDVQICSMCMINSNGRTANFSVKSLKTTVTLSFTDLVFYFPSWQDC